MYIYVTILSKHEMMTFRAFGDIQVKILEILDL